MKNFTSLSVAWDGWRAKRGGLTSIQERQQARLRELVTFARTYSHFYREKYKEVPEEIRDVKQLPIVTKPELMAHFDDWVTDRAIKKTDVEAFVADKSRIGETFLDKYVIFTTSGSTGVPVILIQDAQAQAVTTGLTYIRGLGMVSLGEYWKIFRQGGRQVALFATEGHFLGVTMLKRRIRSKPWRVKMSRIISVLTPLSEIVKELNEFQPSMVGGYATVLTLLAEEQNARRLQIHPAMITSSGETLSLQNRIQIETAFGCTLTESYGCSEATPLTITCKHQRLHVNSDWFILEAVSADHQPVPPGYPSHSVLVTNLANHVQPILRYELGDSVTVNPDPCPCGSPFPSLQVIGRTDEILAFQTSNNATIRVLPLALLSVIKETPGVHRFQAIQTGPMTLLVRLEVKQPGEKAGVWQALKKRLHEYFKDQGLSRIEIELSTTNPARDPRSGKFRHVWKDFDNPV